MFDFLKKNKNQNRLSSSEENALMIVISEAEYLDNVGAEITKLYKSIHPPMWIKMLTKKFKDKNEDELFDPYHDGWYKMLYNRNTYDKKSAVFSWIFTIITNTIRNFFDLSDNKVERYDSVIKNYLGSGESEDYQAKGLIIKNEFINEYMKENIPDIFSEIATITNIIEMIENELEKDIIKLYFFEGKKLTEIAEIKDISISRISKVKDHAIASIRSEYYKEINKVKENAK